MKISGHFSNLTSALLISRDKESGSLARPMPAIKKEERDAHTKNLKEINIRRDRGLHARLAMLLPHSKPDKNKSELMQSLIGASINPEIITESMMSKVNFDGYGRILSFSTNVSSDMLNILENNKIRPITETHSPLADDISRSPRGCLVEFIHALEKYDTPATKALATEARSLWMSGNLSSTNVAGFFDYIGKKQGIPLGIHTLAEKLGIAVTEKQFTGQAFDNIYGRKFDSEFAHDLVKNPPEELVSNAKKMGTVLGSDIEKFLLSSAPQQQERILRTIADKIAGDIRPWQVETPEVQAFVDKPTIENLTKLFTKVENGFDAIKIPYLGVKLSLALDNLQIGTPWMAEANLNYSEVVGPARTTHPPEIQNGNEHHGYGLKLHHHPAYEENQNFQPGKNWTSEKIMNLGGPSSFEMNALTHGNPVSNGASGSTNIMAFLNQYIAAQDPTFSADQSALTTMMFVVLDGGHSANEVMAVHDVIKNTPKERYQNYNDVIEARKQGLASYHVNYNDIIKLGAEAGYSQRIEQALDSALGKTVTYHAESHPAQAH